jgi:hypothetical protein
MLVIGKPVDASASRARSAAKPPTPITCFASHQATRRRSASSHGSNSRACSAAGSLSGVRFRPDASMNTSGQ